MFGSELNLVDGILIILLTMFFISIIIKFSSTIGMLDIPNDRSSHVAPTPRGAGVAMFFSYFIILAIFNGQFILDNIGFFSALLLIFALGVYDDNVGVSPKWKFVLIIVAILIIFFVDDFRIDHLGEWFGFDIHLPMFLALLVTIFAVVGFTNALNLLDGLDGLAGGVSLVIFSSFLYIGYFYGDEFIVTISLVMIFSLIGFLFFNWSPANIFMGDSGSLVFGFVIATVAVKSIEYINVMSVLLLTALPIVDTVVVMTRRLQRGLSPFNPDKTHIHHKILTWRGSVDHSVMILVLIQVHFSIVGIFFRYLPNELNLFLVLLVLYLFFNFLDERKLVRERLFITRIKKRLALIVREYVTPFKSLVILVALILLLFVVRILSF
jgi:UDP-GlcNAc:undecaprenyl-phosphate GlcNAc-1-phosphate transferase